MSTETRNGILPGRRRAPDRSTDVAAEAPGPAAGASKPRGCFSPGLWRAQARAAGGAALILAGVAAGAPAAETAAGVPSSLSDAIAAGAFTFNVRLRYEGVRQDGLRDADALTLRTRVGWGSAPFRGLRLLVEGENITAADGDRYSQAGLNSGGAGRAVVADPETTELNQLRASYAIGGTTITAGRQRLVLDNARFIGDVGWRQNMQTFDGVVAEAQAPGKTALTYAYLRRVHRVFSRRHAQGRWDSDSHVLHGSFRGWSAGTITVYGYLLDFDGAAGRANACATYGASLAGTRALSAGPSLNYRLEAATQADHGASALDYRAGYGLVEAGLAFKPAGLTAGCEVLGADRGVGFKTPLATLHAFNGWADVFLGTPGDGLRNGYLRATATLPLGLSLIVAGHDFVAARGGARFGRELDVQVTRRLGRGWSLLAKLAEFYPAGRTLPRVSKIWMQAEWAR